MRFGDYWVQPLDERSIEGIANEWRALAHELFGGDFFNVVDFVNKVFQRRHHRGQRLAIKFMAKDHPGPPAKVSYGPLVLHVRVDVWEAARNGEAWARYIIAHECGHIVLHDHTAKGFSTPTAQRLPPAERLRSAEWQADKFADYLLAPTLVIERQNTVWEAAVRCGIPHDVAERRVTEVDNYWKAEACLHDTEECSKCHGYEGRRIGARIRCLCGSMSAMAL
jgi:hypothetical protein